MGIHRTFLLLLVLLLLVNGSDLKKVKDLGFFLLVFKKLCKKFRQLNEKAKGRSSKRHLLNSGQFFF